MICFKCFRPIRGADVARRYEWRKDPDGYLRVYGEGALDGKLKDAKGQLVRVSHNKCYHAWKKQLDLAAAKAADPEAQPRPESDWRHQEVIDVEDLQGEGHGDHRGAGAAG